MIVADASALVLAVRARSGEVVRNRLAEAEVHCPSHVDAEVGQALRRAALEIPSKERSARIGLHEAARLIDVRREIPGALSSLAWSLRERVSFYDGLYVALAVILDVPLLTADARLTRAGLPCEVELVA